MDLEDGPSVGQYYNEATSYCPINSPILGFQLGLLSIVACDSF